MTFSQILNDCGSLWLTLGLGCVSSIFVLLYMDGWGLPGRDLKSFWQTKSVRKEYIHCFIVAGYYVLGIAVGVQILGTLMDIV